MSDRVTQTTVLTKSLRDSNLPDSRVRHSLSDLRQETLVSMSGRTCHHCHAPQSDPIHVGIPTGMGHCTLDHWEQCTLQQPDGYDKHKKLWTGCPSLDETREEGDRVVDTTVDEEDDDNEVTVKTTNLPKNVAEAAEMLKAAAAAANKDVLEDDSGEDTEDEENRLALEEIEKLKQRVELNKKQIDADKALALKVARKEKRQADRLKIEQLRADLVLAEKIQMQEKATLSRLTKTVPDGSSASAKSSQLKAKAEAHAARQQQAAADRAKLANIGLLNIDGIRKLPGLPQQVEEYLRNIQADVPSLARDPSAANNSGVHLQPPGVLDSRVNALSSAMGGLSVDQGYVYVAELGKLVPTISTLGTSTGAGILRGQQAIPEQVGSDSEVSGEDDCPVSPSPGCRLAWKRDIHGVKYCVEKELCERSPEVVTAWVKRADGRIYKEQLTREGSSRSGTGAGARSATSTKSSTTTPKRTPKFIDHRLSGKQVRTADRTQSRRDDRQPSFIATEERAGKETGVPNLVKRARFCPVAWTDKITSEQLNPVIWSWAYIADLLAARSGQAPNLETGELEARLQHFLNVMEVTLQTSGKTDYMGDSWKVGRLYHTKVQAKVDQGSTSWCKMVDRWEDATLPHELMAAQQELAPRQNRTRNKETDRQTERPRDGDGKVPRCGSWNIWETKGTCEWESKNPGEKCNRLHECTYCKTKKFKPVTHQRLFCSKRLAAGSD